LVVTDSSTGVERSGLDPQAYRSGVDLLVLGPVEVRNQGEPVSIGGPKQRSILALLVADAGRPVSVDRIIEDVYGDDAPDGARRSVQTLVSMIRRELGDIVHQAANGYVLTVEAEAIDAVRFEGQVRTAMSMVEADPEQAATALRDALAVWRGHPYSDIDSRAVLEPEITRLRELRLAALEARIDADLALGRHRELTGELEALTVEHPLREKFRAQHMLALYRSGRQTEALRGFGRTRSYLADEIGITPSKELADLEQRILEQDPLLDLPAAPSVTQRAVLVVELAGGDGSGRLAEGEREAITEALTLIDETVERNGGEGCTQRGSAVYATFAKVDEAVVAVDEVMSVTGEGVLPRASIDFGDIERHDSGEVAGPPVRRGAGLVAAAHPGQVLLSAEANQALSAIGASGSLVRSLGIHRIQGVEALQPIFQIVLAGHDGAFPPLLLDVNPPPLPADRRAVAGYELREPIISDLSGTTYRAYQPSAGREVEMTVIDPAWAGEPAFVSRFEVETQHIGRLQHPHLLPLLDHWRDPGGAYLVTMWLGGGTLTDRLVRGRLDLEQGRRLVTQIGAALSYAHHEGIVHGALSPGAVTLDASGNGYLSTTRLVVRLTGAPQTQSRYLAPECARGEPLTPATDVYGMGRLVADVLGIEGLLGRVIEQATADLPAARYPSMDEFISAVGGAIGLDVPESDLAPLRNPYKGLSAFQEADSGDFFGRSGAVSDLVELLAERKLVAVIGPSGSGKSSLVHAGLIPAVRAGALDGADNWVVATMFPGSYPLEELESALGRVAVEDPGVLMDELEHDDRGLSRVIKRILPADTQLLLVIDQFEELFTLTHDELARNRLLSALVNLANDERSDTRVVLTLRADFFDRPLQYPEFGELLKRGIVPFTVPTDDELIDAIKRPADGVGASWEPGLPEQILADVSRAPGTLPLLQYALTELFTARTGHQLTHQVYLQNGGVLGALAGRAEEAFARLDASQGALARQLFLRLVTVRSAGEATRRRARLVELNALGDPGEVGTVLATFGDARLLVFDRDPISRSPTAEVAHEALLTSWPRLAAWIDEAGEDLLLHGRLRDGAAEWEDRDREGGYLLTGGRLAQFDAWAGSTDFTLAPSEIDFLEASREEADKVQARRRRRRNLITAGFGAAAVVAGIFAVNADRNAEIAESRELAASAINVLDEDPELSVLLALEAAGIADPPLESVSAIHESLAAHHKILTYQLPSNLEALEPFATLSPDGLLLATSGGGTTSRWWRWIPARGSGAGSSPRKRSRAPPSVPMAPVWWRPSDGLVATSRPLIRH
jgi:DNA-binding SARP family transcriptional activator/serine/threonine protein kinase